MSKRETTKRADQELLEDIGYGISGGWRGLVGDLVYQLRCVRGHWFDYADRLERLLQENKEPSLQEEQFLLRRVKEELASIKNHPKADLVEEQRGRLTASLQAAIHGTLQRQQAIPKQARKEKREKRNTRKLEEYTELIEAASRRGAPRRNKDRNAWIVKQRKKGKTCQAILDELQDQCEKSGWQSVSSPQAIHAICVKSKSNLAIAAIHAKSNFKSNR